MFEFEIHDDIGNPIRFAVPRIPCCGEWLEHGGITYTVVAVTFSSDGTFKVTVF